MIVLGEQLAAMSAQAQEYLEAICRIQDRGDMATPTELARELGLAPPSVLGMMRRLADQQLLTYSRQTGAQLTPCGQEHADAVRRRHRLAERLLTDLLGIPWERAHHIACRFEHVIDEEVESYLIEALHHPDTCPHGNPLDITAVERYLPLTALAIGQSGRLRRVVDETAPTLDYLTHLRLRPGVQVTVCDYAPFDGPLTVEVEGERHAVSRVMATSLLIEPEATV